MSLTPAEFDRAFARLVAQRGWLTSDDIDKVARIAASRQHAGETCTIADVCRELMFLQAAQIRELIAALKPVEMICSNPDCRARFTVVDFQSQKTYSCKRCGSVLTHYHRPAAATPTTKKVRVTTLIPAPAVLPPAPAMPSASVPSALPSEPRKPKSLNTSATLRSANVPSIPAPEHLVTPPSGTPAPAPAPLPKSRPDTTTPIGEMPAAPPAPMPGQTRTTTRHGKESTSAPAPAPAPESRPVRDGTSSKPSLPTAPEGTNAGLDSLPDMRDPARSAASDDDAHFEPPPNRGTVRVAHPLGDVPAVGESPPPPNVKLLGDDDLYDSLFGVESQKTADEADDEDAPLFDFSELGLVDVAAVDAEIAAERSEADTFTDLEAITDEPDVDLNADAAEDDDDADFDDDAFSAALSNALVGSDSAGHTRPAADVPPVAAPADPSAFRAQTADLLAAISEVEKAFESRRKDETDATFGGGSGGIGGGGNNDDASILVRTDDGFSGAVYGLSATGDSMGRDRSTPAAADGDDFGGFTLDDLARGAADRLAQKPADESTSVSLEELAQGVEPKMKARLPGPDTALQRILDFSPDRDVVESAIPSGSDVELEASGPATPPTHHAVATAASQDSAAVEAGRQALASIVGGPARYQMEGELAAGGMGEVHRVRDLDLRRVVAMKIIKRDAHKNPAYIARFVDEAQINGQLEHPNIVPVHELGVRRDGRVFFTQKLVNGYSLAHVLAGVKRLIEKNSRLGPLKKRNSVSPVGVTAVFDSPDSQPTARRRKRPDLLKLSTDALDLAWMLMVFLKVCDAVAFAHSRGVIHRDLKPANIMIGDYGEVLVVDWGCAKVIDRPGDDSHAEGVAVVGQGVSSFRTDAGAQTMAGAIRGTPQYMAPEQAQGRIDELDERTDVYALGATFYEMLTVCRPFDHLFEELGESAGLAEASVNLLGRIVAESPIPPRHRAPDRQIPKELEAVVLRAMAKRPGDRYATVAEMTRDIRLFITGHTLSAMNYSFFQRVLKFIGRHPLATTAILLGVAALTVGAFLARDFTLRQHQNEIRQQAAQLQRTAEQAATAGDFARAAEIYWGVFALVAPDDHPDWRKRYDEIRVKAEETRLAAHHQAELQTRRQAAETAVRAADGVAPTPDFDGFVRVHLDALGMLRHVLERDPADRHTRQHGARLAERVGNTALAHGHFELADWAYRQAGLMDSAAVNVDMLLRRIQLRKDELAAETRRRITDIFETARTEPPPERLDELKLQLATLKGPGVALLVSARLSDRSVSVRKLAIDALPFVPDDATRHIAAKLADLVNSPAEPLAIRVAAARSLGQVGSTDHAETVWRLGLHFGTFENVFGRTSAAYRRLDPQLSFGRDSSDPRAVHWRRLFIGLDRLQAHDPLGAHAVLAQAVAEVPAEVRATDALVLLAQAQRALGHTTDAVENLQLATRAEPNHFLAHLWLSRLYRERGEFALAVAQLQQADRLDSADVRLFIERAAVFLSTNEFAAAEQMTNRGLKFEPDLPVFFAMRAAARGHLGRLDEALRDIDTALKAQPDNVEWRFWRAQWLMRSASSDAAEREWARILARDSNHGPTFAARGAYYLSLGDHRRALDDLRRAVDALSDAVPPRLNLADCHLAREEFQAAIAVLRDAWRTTDDPVVRADIEARLAAAQARLGPE